jgi:hypothetical protein
VQSSRNQAAPFRLVGLSPELRKTGMVMRWYKDENNGWIHDSMLEVVKAGEK